MSNNRHSSSFRDPDDPRHNLKEKSVRGVFATAVSSAFDLVLRLGSVSVLAHLIVPEHFGLVGMITALTAIGSQIVHLGLGIATVQRPGITQRQLSNLFWINAGFGAFLTVLLCGLAPVVAHFFQEPRLSAVTMALSLGFLCSGLCVQHEAIMTRQMRQGAQARVRMGSLLVSVVVALLLAWRGFGYWALVGQELARALCLMLGFWWLSGWRPGLPSREGGLGALFRFGWNMTLTNLLNTVVLNLDRLLLGRVFGAEAVGLYGRAQQLILAPMEQLNGPIQSVAQPALSRLQDDPERFRRYFHKIVFFIGLATMPFAAVGIVFAEEVTLLVLGSQWAHAAVLFRVFSVWVLIRPVLGMAGVVLISTGQTQRLLNYAYLRNAVFIVMTVMGLNWGMVGVAVAQACSTYLLLLPCLWYSFARSPVSVGLFFQATRTPLVATALFTAALFLARSWLIELPMLGTVLVGCLVASPVYLAGTLLWPSDRRELLAVVGHLRVLFRPAPAAAPAKSDLPV